LQVSY